MVNSFAYSVTEYINNTPSYPPENTYLPHGETRIVVTSPTWELKESNGKSHFIKLLSI